MILHCIKLQFIDESYQEFETVCQDIPQIYLGVILVKKLLFTNRFTVLLFHKPLKHGRGRRVGSLLNTILKNGDVLTGIRRIPMKISRRFAPRNGNIGKFIEELV